MKWYQVADLKDLPDGVELSSMIAKLSSHAANQDKLLEYSWLNGTLDKSYDNLISLINNTFYAAKIYSYRDIENNPATETFVGEDSFVSLDFKEDNFVNIWFASTDHQKYIDFFQKINTYVCKIKPKGGISALTMTPNGPVISHIGHSGVDLIETNYDEIVVNKIKHVVNDLQSQTPCGRMSILNGCPGTGKTFLVKSIVNDVSNGLFIIISPEIVQQLAKPEIITVLINHKNQQGAYNKNIPFIFIVEDADQILAPRGSDNMADISAVLNLSDGILGQVLDIRIVATTNAEYQEFDKAALRSGRLCRHVHVDKLTPDQCQKVLERLKVSKELLDKNGYNSQESYILADLYRFAREDAERLETTDKQVGFK